MEPIFNEMNGANGPRKPRKRAVVTIFASGLTAASFSIMLEKLMLEKTNVHKRVNLGACPDHYAMQPHGDNLKSLRRQEQPAADTVFS